MVQRNWYVPAPPALVKVAEGLVVLLNCESKVLGPETTDHAPVPTTGELAPSITFGVVVHTFWFDPALEAVGTWSTVTALVLIPLVPQLFPAVTVIFPLSPALPAVTVMEVEPCPAVIVQPAGTFHVYVVAFGTADILYTLPVVFEHPVAAPVMAPGVAGTGGFMLTAMLLTEA